MEFPDNLKYTKEHEWVRLEGDIATMGITDYAQEQLGDIVFVELPSEGESVKQGEPFGVVESVKAVSDLYAAVSGEVAEVNDTLDESPETLNEDCYDEGWILKIKIRDKKELDGLLDHQQYQALVNEEGS